MSVTCCQRYLLPWRSAKVVQEEAPEGYGTAVHSAAINAYTQTENLFPPISMDTGQREAAVDAAECGRTIARQVEELTPSDKEKFMHAFESKRQEVGQLVPENINAKEEESLAVQEKINLVEARRALVDAQHRQLQRANTQRQGVTIAATVAAEDLKELERSFPSLFLFDTQLPKRSEKDLLEYKEFGDALVLTFLYAIQSALPDKLRNDFQETVIDIATIGQGYLSIEQRITDDFSDCLFVNLEPLSKILYRLSQEIREEMDEFLQERDTDPNYIEKLQKIKTMITDKVVKNRDEIYRVIFNEYESALGALLGNKKYIEIIDGKTDAYSKLIETSLYAQVLNEFLFPNSENNFANQYRRSHQTAREFITTHIIQVTTAEHIERLTQFLKEDVTIVRAYLEQTKSKVKEFLIKHKDALESTMTTLDTLLEDQEIMGPLIDMLFNLVNAQEVKVELESGSFLANIKIVFALQEDPKLDEKTMLLLGTDEYTFCRLYEVGQDTLPQNLSELLQVLRNYQRQYSSTCNPTQREEIKVFIKRMMPLIVNLIQETAAFSIFLEGYFKELENIKVTDTNLRDKIHGNLRKISKKYNKKNIVTEST
jgi:hypothetical protein